MKLYKITAAHYGSEEIHLIQAENIRDCRKIVKDNELERYTQGNKVYIEEVKFVNGLCKAMHTEFFETDEGI